VSGYTLTQPELYYSLPSAVTKNTYTAQAPISALTTTSVPRCLIPALYFNTVGKSAHWEANGTIANTSAATFVFAAGLDTSPGTIAGTGGGTLFTMASVTPTAAVTCLFTMEFDIVCQAVGGGNSGTAGGTTLQVNGEIHVSTIANQGWTAGSTAKQTAMAGNTVTGVNNEINLWLELFGTWSASAAGNTTTLQQFKVYLEN
jgi:hypothetical protein